MTVKGFRNHGFKSHEFDCPKCGSMDTKCMDEEIYHPEDDQKHTWAIYSMMCQKCMKPFTVNKEI